MQLSQLKNRVRDLVNNYSLVRENPGLQVHDFVFNLLSILQWGMHDSTRYHKLSESRSGNVFLFELGSYDSFLLSISNPVHSESDHFTETTYRALEHGYNRMVPWVVSTNFESLNIHNVYWGKHYEDTVFRSLRFQEYQKRLEDLWLLSVDSFSNGLIFEQELRERPTETKVPVDRTLVERTKMWRKTLLANAPSHIGDMSVQNFLHQLFFIRRCEDQGLERAYLQDVLKSKSPSATLSQILKYFQDTYDTDLFSHIVSDWEDNDLTRVVSELYDAGFGLRYNFADLPGDILGQIYQEYTSSVARVETRSHDEKGQLWLWPKSDVRFESVQKDLGIFYTPRDVVEYMVELGLRDHFRNHGDNSLPKVIDPACGSGGFLTQSLESLRAKGFSADDSLSALWGIDLDPSAVTATRLGLWLGGVSARQLLPSLSAQIVEGNALSDEAMTLQGFEPESFDIVFGNPPFKASKHMDEEERLYYLQRFQSAEAKFDKAHLFVERGLEWLKPGGLMVMVVPTQFLNTTGGASLRRLLRRKASIEQVVDFGDAQLFKGAQTYVSIVYIRKTEPRDTFPLVQVTKWGRSTIAQLEAWRNCTGHTPDIRVVSARFSQTGDQIVDSLVIQVLDIARGQTRPAKEVLDFFQGIRSGADDVFVVEVTARDKREAVCRTKSGLRVLEADLLIPLVKGEHIRRFSLRSSTEFLIFPYQGQSLISEEDLKRQYPKTYQYLLENHAKLSQRQSLKRTQGPWYSFIWPRVEELVAPGKILSPVVALTSSFSLDETGVAFTSGTGLRPKLAGASPYSLLAYLNSSFVSWYVRSLSSHYANGYVEFKSSVLKDLPIPLDLIQLEGIGLANRLDNLGRQVFEVASGSSRNVSAMGDLTRAIDDEVFSMLEVPPALQESILERLAASFELERGDE